MWKNTTYEDEPLMFIHDGHGIPLTVSMWAHNNCEQSTKGVSYNTKLQPSLAQAPCVEGLVSGLALDSGFGACRCCRNVMRRAMVSVSLWAFS